MILKCICNKKQSTRHFLPNKITKLYIKSTCIIKNQFDFQTIFFFLHFTSFAYLFEFSYYKISCLRTSSRLIFFLFQFSIYISFISGKPNLFLEFFFSARKYFCTCTSSFFCFESYYNERFCNWLLFICSFNSRKLGFFRF